MAQFKTRARALDLLGRQQIAGIPTAINELIKNAYDAYADHFDVDYFRGDQLLVLRDDGIGMTKNDFETRWLTLGTESKLQNTRSSLPPTDPNKEKRPITGEKGIGRLAIASIGQQVLILTKAKYPQNSSQNKIVAAFINWGMFELPGINLEDIVIPIKEFDSVPERHDIEILKQEVLQNIIYLKNQNLITSSEYDKIEKTITAFNVNPYELLEKKLQGVTNFKTSGGTHFYISPVDDVLNSDIDGEKGDDEATKMEKMLLGFHNTMTPNHPTAQIDIAFREYHKDNGSFTSIIDKEHFFTPKEFEMADHQFTGVFDKFGQFKGDVRIYGEKIYNDYTVNWKDNHYRETLCGPFTINFAYIQGEQKSSRLSTEDYARLKAKGDKFGGLYIYRNNIRVLPYGNSDYDFLDIEKNRSKRASTAFFSYRRMFGAISITDNDGKSLLVEKAGREGFIENKAYKELQSILKNFMWQLAADFFFDGSNSPYSDFYKQKKAEFNTHYAALEKREKMNRAKKNKFLKELDIFFERLASHQFETDIQKIIDNFSIQLTSLSLEKDSDIASEKLLQTEFEARKRLAEYKKAIAVAMPKGFTISKTARQDYNAYCEEYETLLKTTFKEAEEKIDNLIEAYTKARNLEVSKRKRLEQAVELISSEAKSINQKKRNETNDVVTTVSKKVKELTSELVIDLDKQIQSVREQFINLKTNNSGTFDLVTERQRMENEIESISIRNTELMDRIIRQFESFYIEKDDNGNIITNDQIEDSLSEELENLKEQVQADVELSQLGLAVGIIHHEFNSTITSIRHSLKDLKAWSDADENLEGIYRNIKVNFEHLDRYLALMMPLNRRLYREREDIPNADIKSFLNDLFKNRLERHHIDFRQTNGFSHGHIYGFRSTFYPVFVNIIDNAIYWLSQSEQPNKMIRLHADDTGIYISNNGPAILPQDKDRIFELRFSRKPKGRGMGLNISKEILNNEGYDLLLINPMPEANVTFKIQKQ
ncbi:MAG: ATP-binding protein [Paludibacteraceae bacterium]|nr:ATP-binding protein [Paludibacteraceae bacterium]